MDFSVLERAGVSQGHFGQLVGVSRVTVHTWVTKKFSPRRQSRARVRQVLAALEAAVAEGALPVNLQNLKQSRLTQIAQSVEPAGA